VIACCKNYLSVATNTAGIPLLQHSNTFKLRYKNIHFVRFSQSLTVGIRQRGRQEVDYQL